MGETASGKSELAINFAKEHEGEIICADSKTIYKGMDIGTAKPSEENRLAIKHHMMDLVNPDQKFTVADFKHQALKVITDIRLRSKLPIMVGGTGLYVDAVIYDYQFRKAYDAKIRNALEQKNLNELLMIAQNEGYSISDLSKNRRHLIRLLESGISSHKDRSQMIDNVIIVGLTIKRSVLRKNIENRVERMFKLGLRKEVDELVRKYGWSHESLTGIGYREFEEYYIRSASISKVKQTIIQHTLKYAKRQRTWFKRNPNIKWCENIDEANKFLVKQIVKIKV